MKRTKTIIAAVLVVCLALAFAGCGKPKASASLEEAIKAVQNFDAEKMALYYGGSVTDDFGDTDLYTSTVLQAMTKHLTYKITNSTEKDGKAAVEVAFTNADMSVIFAKYLAEALSNVFSDAMTLSEDELQTKYQNIFIELLNADDATLKTTTATVNMTYDAEKKIWTVDSDSVETMINAMFGGIYDVSESFSY